MTATDTKRLAQATLDARTATGRFNRIVKPILLPILGHGRFYQVEGIKHPLFEDLDRNAGIDWFHISANNRMMALAVRVQECQTPYRTFSIRFERSSGTTTEFEKRQRDRAEGFLVPTHTIQSYISPQGKHLATGIVKTTDLLDFIKTHPELVRYQENGEDQNTFMVVQWDDLKAHGIDVLVIEQPN